MTSTIPQITDSAPTTTLTCEHCTAQIIVIDNETTARDAWEDEHAKCALPYGTRVIEEFIAALPGVGNLLEDKRPAWSDPAEDRVNDAAPMFSEWRSVGIEVEHPGSENTSHFSAGVVQTVDQALPLVQLRRHEITADEQRVRRNVFAVPATTARQLAAALNLLADLADGSEVTR